MKILIITPGMLPVPATKGGAVEVLIDYLVSNKTIYYNNDITLYTINGECNNLNKYNCNFKFINTNGLFYKIGKIIRFLINRLPNIYIGNMFIYKVVKEIIKNKEKYDIIIVENQPFYGYLLKKKKIKSKIYLHLHNDFLNINTKMAKKIKESYDGIFPISNFIANRINNIPSKRVKQYLLYNGIDLKRFNHRNFNRIELRKKYNYYTNDFIFMYSGRVVPEKGVLELIKAFNKIENKNAKLIIVGNVSDKKYYKKIIVEAELKKDSINIMGFVDYEKMPEICSIANVGIVPTLCNEAFGLVIIEFQALGVPVITSSNGAMKEIVNAENNGGIIVDSDSNFENNLYLTMNRFMKLSSKKYNKYVEGAINNSKKFSKDNYCNNFLKIVERISSNEKR